MPKMELPSKAEWLSSYLAALMYFPQDAKLRDYALNLDYVGNHIHQQPNDFMLALPAEILRVLMDAPPIGEMKKLEAESVKQGVIAGDLLLSIYLMEATGVKEPSMNKALKQYHKFAASMQFGDGSRMPKPEQTLRNAWKSHISVSHLWAAYRLNQSAPQYPVRETFRSLETMTKLMQVAATFQEFACKFTPKRTNNPQPLITRESIWLLPEWYVENREAIDPDPFKESVNNLYSDYRAPVSL